MTRKDYELIADAIASCGLPRAARRTVTGAIALALAGDNPRFDRDRFVARAVR